MPPPVPVGGAGFGGAVPPPGQVAPPGKIRHGTAFGVEFGRAYVVNREGKLLQTLRLPYESFQQVLQPPPAALRPNGPFSLPPRAAIKGG